uniref:tyrosine--tRNA ligase n=1 Tax=Quercus lobata TaxID=97700 RepID=A0A7N2KTN2_QUELO
MEKPNLDELYHVFTSHAIKFIDYRMMGDGSKSESWKEFKTSCLGNFAKNLVLYGLESAGLLWAGICRKSIEEVQEKKMLLEKLQVRMNEAKAKAKKLKVSFENLLKNKPEGVMKAINVNKSTSAGCKVKIWIVDWFAQLTNKMGGQLKKIDVVGRYLIEIWKAVGMDIDGGKVEFLRLQQGQEKMSKSDPLSSTFMEDDEAKVNLKIKRAYCPPDIVEGNPCLEYVKYLILPWFKKFVIERSAENGGDN